MNPTTRLGAGLRSDKRCAFRVWAPNAEKVDVVLVADPERVVPMAPQESGYFEIEIDAVEAGQLYQYRLNDQMQRPDPASRLQPLGVHGFSEVTPADFDWSDDNWSGIALEAYVIYELHVGTFTATGTFEAAIEHLDRLKSIGVTAIELMPIAQFPGERNWGYDGVDLFAAQNSYGGPVGLKRLVDACHQRGLAVILDVVYNHLGPEGNYLADFGPYFTDRYRTPWGSALNFDGPHSDHVRSFFIENALYWLVDCHVDALRLDAVHAIVDHSATPFLEALATAVDERTAPLNRRVHLIAETSLNDPRLVRSRDKNGFGLDAQWNDDFHHALHSVVTGERDGYYTDFGTLEDLARAFRDGYVYTGQYSEYRQRRHGRSAADVPASRLVVFAQNHDQVGNRMLAERLPALVSFETLKLTAGIVSLSPFVPLLFMGEEYGETAPFLYFISHTDPELIEAVRRGRREEFAAFSWQGEAPDPQNESTFLKCKLNHSLRDQGHHAALWSLWSELFRLRRALSSLCVLDRAQMHVQAFESERLFVMRRWNGNHETAGVFNFSDARSTLAPPLPSGEWSRVLDSADSQWHGPGSDLPELIRSDGRFDHSIVAQSFVLLARTRDPE